MIGAESLLRTLLANGVNLCLANPGTSEMQFVAALERVPEMRGVLCLFEGVCSGAADGYARMTGRPAATLLHLGPGLANGLANFHNARKARSPVVSIVGEHASWHHGHGSPLESDVAAFARTVSGWTRVVECAEQMGAAAAEAVRASYGPPGQVATLIVPADFSWSEAGQPGPAMERPVARPAAPEAIRETARLLRSGEPCGFFLSGSALFGAGLEAAGRLAAASGARMVANRYAARLERGRGRFAPQRLAYFPEQAEPMLAGLRRLFLVETERPVSFFGYPGRPSELAPPDCQIQVLAGAEEDGAAALDSVAHASVCIGELPLLRRDREGAQAHGGTARRAPQHESNGVFGPAEIGVILAELLPEGAIVADEAVSSGEEIGSGLASAAPHDLLPVTGGAIGQGLPVALGAALACPDRKVVALEADGSGLYTVQALWTMARERLDVVVILLNNRRYRILDIEMRRTGGEAPGARAGRMIGLDDPDLDWVRLAGGFGVPAIRASTAGEFRAQLRSALGESGPRLIEAVL